MAKSTKSKKNKEEEVVAPPTENLVEETVTPIEEVEINEEPKVEELKVVEPELVAEKAEVTVTVSEPPKLPKEADKSLPMEERVAAYVESRGMVNWVKLNDFLKSLFPLPKYNEPPVWLEQGVNKQIRNMLNDMQAKGQITIQDNRHIRLGTPYYPDSTTLKTHYHNLNSVIIEAMGADKK